MAHSKKANAMVVHPYVSRRQWSRTRTAATSGASNRNLTDQAREILGGSLDPDKYLFTHCTIVASVDTEQAPNAKLGRVRVGSRTIDRRWGDYYITDKSAQFVNNNGDCWSRPVLLASYPTFIAGHNFQEHVQVEAQSKGRILDAVARDIGDSVYIDILVATNRKHETLVRDIQAGVMGTLSMGCFLPGTMVTMADGCRIPIEEIQPGDMVLTHKGRARPVANLQIRRRPWSMRRLKMVGVPEDIVTTSTHPFFVYRAPKACACGCGEPLPQRKISSRSTLRDMHRRFKVGHDKRVWNPNANYSPEEAASRKARMAEIQEMRLEEVTAGDLQPYDFAVFPRARFDGQESDSGLSLDRAKLLGYFLAEGSFLKRGGERVEVEFSFSYEERDTYAAEVAALLESEFGGEARINLRPEKGGCAVRMTHREAASWFYHYGGEYSHRKVLAPEVLLWSEDKQKALIAGWVNGDGWLSSSEGSTSGVTTSYDLACQLHLIASRIGAFCAVFSSAKTQEALQVVGGGVIPVRQDNGKLPAYELRFGQTQAQVFAGHSDKVCLNPHFSSQGLRVNEDYVMFPITSVESEPYNGFVYDMEVEEDHSYVVEGVAVHNCTTDFTICSQCGHVAVDETDLCDHIKISKLNSFLDERQQKRVVAELCGHIDYKDNPDAPGGVNFIEASWVKVPAFPGAVMRNLLEAGDLPPQQMKQALQRVLSQAPTGWSDSAMSKAANLIVPKFRKAFDFGGDDEEEDDAPKKGEPKKPFEEITDQVYEKVKDKVHDRIDQDLKEDEASEADSEVTFQPNDSIQREAGAQMARKAYQVSMDLLIRTASSQVALVEGVATLNQAYGIPTDPAPYRVALKVGSPVRYSSPQDYKRAIQRAAGRELSSAELRVVVRVGSLLSKWERNNNPQTL
jgi:hypothetical protein